MPGRGARQEAVTKRKGKKNRSNEWEQAWGSICFGRQESFPQHELGCGAEPGIGRSQKL